MSQCVPSWDLDENTAVAAAASRLCFRSQSNSSAPDVPMLDYEYEVAELTWENGQLAMHGLGPPRVQPKPQSTTWDKPHAGGTLESIVNQATRLPVQYGKPTATFEGGKNVPWFENRQRTPAGSAATMTMDALVPCSNTGTTAVHHVSNGGGVGGCSTRVGSCSGTAVEDDREMLISGKRARIGGVVARVQDMDRSASGSATFGTQHVTVDTCEREFSGVGLTATTSFGSQENTTTTSSGMPCTKTDDHDSVCHNRSHRDVGDEDDKRKGNRKSSVSTKRSRAAAIHNQYERKRRDKINERMKTLQKLVPNSNKTDKASMLDEVIDYLKQLQAQIQMMNRMNNMSPMMLPMAMQQQLQMSMMAPMMGMAGMGMGPMMDLNTISRNNIPNISPVISPASFLPMAATSWDHGAATERLQSAGPASMMAQDPMSAFLASQSQPMTMDTYIHMAAMYQQLQQQQQQLPTGSYNLNNHHSCFKAA